jgi:sporulation protein YlmC with PRC-barrel domain
LRRSAFALTAFTTGPNQWVSASNLSTLIAAGKVQGAPIYDAAGDNLGSIDDIVIDRKTGNVAYALMSSDGFLGIGTRHHALPWSMLKYDGNLGAYVVHLERAQLHAAPACGQWL